MLLLFTEFKTKYPTSEITEAEYNMLYSIVWLQVKAFIVYSECDIKASKEYDTLKNILSLQINHNHENGLESDGISSESTSGVSVSYKNEIEKGAFNWHSIAFNYLKNSVFRHRKI